MEREAAIAALKAHETEFKQLGVEHLYLFGSTARGEARDDSDVDLSLLQNSISATHFAFIRRCERPRLRPARAGTA